MEISQGFVVKLLVRQDVSSTSSLYLSFIYLSNFSYAKLESKIVYFK